MSVLTLDECADGDTVETTIDGKAEFVKLCIPHRWGGYCVRVCDSEGVIYRDSQLICLPGDTGCVLIHAAKDRKPTDNREVKDPVSNG